VYKRETRGQLNWGSWRARALEMNSKTSTAVWPGESLEVLGVEQ